MNILINNSMCPYCNNKIQDGVISDYFTFDKFHDELYCNQCGLIVKNNDLPTIEDLEYMSLIDGDNMEKLVNQFTIEFDNAIKYFKDNGYVIGTNNNVLRWDKEKQDFIHVHVALFLQDFNDRCTKTYYFSQIEHYMTHLTNDNVDNIKREFIKKFK